MNTNIYFYNTLYSNDDNVRKSMDKYVIGRNAEEIDNVLIFYIFLSQK